MLKTMFGKQLLTVDIMEQGVKGAGGSSVYLLFI